MYHTLASFLLVIEMALEVVLALEVYRPEYHRTRRSPDAARGAARFCGQFAHKRYVYAPLRSADRAHCLLNHWATDIE